MFSPKVRLGVRFPLATTHPVWMDGEGWGVGVHRAVVTWHALGVVRQGCYMTASRARGGVARDVTDWNVICFVGDIYSNVVVCTKLGVLVVGSAPNWHENAFCIFIVAHVSHSQVHNLLTIIFNVSLYFLCHLFGC